MGVTIWKIGVSLIYFFLSLAVTSLADATINEIVWKDASSGIRESDLQRVVVSPDNAEIVYTSSFNTLYKTTDGGKKWNEVLSFRGTGNTIHSVAISPLSPMVVYVGTQDGLFKSKDEGVNWEKVFSGAGDLKGSILSLAINPTNSENIFIGTKAGLLWTDNGGGDWKEGQNLPSDALVSFIAIDPSVPDIIYAATDRGVYKSINSGVDWKRIIVTNIPEDNNIKEDTDELELVEISGAETNIRCIAIDPVDSRKIYLGTSEGLIISEDSGLTWRLMSSFGLISQDIYHLILTAADPDSIYAATNRGVFRYSKISKTWEELYKGLTSVDIRFLTHTSTIQDRTITLWAATKNGVFKTSYTRTKNREVVSERTLSIFADEPSIEEIQRAAIRYAEVYPEKIEGWRKAASKKAWLPDLTVKGDDITRGKDFGWSVSVTWQLGDLLWNDDQTSIDVRSKFMVQLRGDVLKKVTRLYFERRRLQIEMLISPPENIKDRIEKELRLQELTADIDALTDFYLSKRLAQLKEQKIQNEKFKMQD